MTPSFFLALASCAVAAPGDGAACPCQQGSVTAPAPAYSQAESVGPVRSWLRNAFGVTPPPPVVARTPPSYLSPTPNRAFPNASGTAHTTLRPSYNAAPPRVVTTPAEPPAAVVEAAAKEEAIPQVAKEYEGKIGHDANYDWVTGHLFYVHTDGGRWVVRYTLQDETDKFGGSVVLAPGVEMRNYREGDLVCVYGEVLQEGRTSRLGGPLYRVNVISLVDRADP